MNPNSRHRPKNRRKDLKNRFDDGKDWGCSDSYHKQARKILKEQLEE